MVEQQRRINRADEPHSGDAATAAAHVVDVVVLSNDDKFLATLREASSEHHSLRHVASPDVAVELLVGGRCGILVADLALLQNDTLQLFERLQAQFPELIILATGRRDEEVCVAAAISSGCIYRFLHKPVSPARASLFLNTATRRYGELRQINALALATLRQKAHRQPHRLGWVIAAAVVGAIGLWLVMERGADQTDRRLTQSPADEYLSRAQSAFKAGRLSDGTQESALAWYRAARAAAPDNDEARSGIDRVLAALDRRVVAALNRDDAVAAEAALSDLQRAHPAHPHLASLRSQLQTLSAQLASRTRRPLPVPVAIPEPVVATLIAPDEVLMASIPAPASVNVSTAAPQPDAPSVTSRVADPPALTPQIDRARARLAASQFIAPVDDSAADYLRRARENGEDETRLKIVATDLGARLLDQSRQALDAGKLQDAQHDYAAAVALDSEFELGLPDLEQIGQRLRDQQAASELP